MLLKMVAIMLEALISPLNNKKWEMKAAPTCHTTSTINHSHSRYLAHQTTVNNNGCIPFLCASSTPTLHTGSLTRLTGNFKCNTTIVKVNMNTCAFPTISSPNVSCGIFWFCCQRTRFYIATRKQLEHWWICEFSPQDKKVDIRCHSQTLSFCGHNPWWVTVIIADQ